MNAGSVYVGNDAAFGTGVLTMGGAVISSDSSSARTMTNAYSVGGAQTLGNASLNGTLTFSGSGTLSSALTLTTDSPVVLSGVLGGAFGVTKSGLSSLTLGGSILSREVPC